MSGDDPMSKTFRYEGYDIITPEKMVEREYEIVEPVVSFNELDECDT